MVNFHVKDCLIHAKKCLKRNDLDTANVMIKLAAEGIEDLEYYFKQTSLQEQKIEFTKIRNDIKDLQCCQRAARMIKN